MSLPRQTGKTAQKLNSLAKLYTEAELRNPSEKLDYYLMQLLILQTSTNEQTSKLLPPLVEQLTQLTVEDKGLGNILSSFAISTDQAQPIHQAEPIAKASKELLRTQLDPFLSDKSLSDESQALRLYAVGTWFHYGFGKFPKSPRTAEIFYLKAAKLDSLGHHGLAKILNTRLGIEKRNKKFRQGINLEKSKQLSHFALYESMVLSNSESKFIRYHASKKKSFIHLLELVSLNEKNVILELMRLKNAEEAADRAAYPYFLLFLYSIARLSRDQAIPTIAEERLPITYITYSAFIRTTIDVLKQPKHKEALLGIAISTLNNKKDWDAFAKFCIDNKLFDAQTLSNKIDTFKLDSSKDFILNWYARKHSPSLFERAFGRGKNRSIAPAPKDIFPSSDFKVEVKNTPDSKSPQSDGLPSIDKRDEKMTKEEGPISPSSAVAISPSSAQEPISSSIQRQISHSSAQEPMTSLGDLRPVIRRQNKNSLFQPSLARIDEDPTTLENIQTELAKLQKHITTLREWEEKADSSMKMQLKKERKNAERACRTLTEEVILLPPDDIERFIKGQAEGRIFFKRNSEPTKSEGPKKQPQNK